MAGFGITTFKLSLPRLFGDARELEAEIDEFLDRLTEGGLVFLKAVRLYLETGVSDAFEDLVEQASAIESRGDELRRGIEIKLYAQTLIPDFRGDVLHLLERLDGLLNIYEGNLYRFSIQKPDIPSVHRRDFLDLAETSVACVESVVLAARAFFRDIEAVRDHNAKVRFHEQQADLINTRLQRAVFGSTLALEQKTQLRYFSERIDELSNQAEDIGDALVIYAIKRRI